MIVFEGRESDLALSVWARGGQAPLRVQTSPLTGDVRQSGDSRGFASGVLGPRIRLSAALRAPKLSQTRPEPGKPGMPPYRSLNALLSHRTMLLPADGFTSGSQVCPSAS